MLKRKIVMYFSVVILAMILISCGEKTETSKTETKTETKKETNTTTETKTVEKTDTITANTNSETKTTEKMDSTTEKTETAGKEEKSADGDFVIMETTMGKIKIKLFTKEAPLTTANFKKLISQKYYDGIIFHRVIDGFMIQGGDPTGTGAGGSKETIKDEFGPGLKHSKKGILSMANRGPNTGSSQFFITLAPTDWLDGKHAIFGEVVEGMDVVDKIGKVKTGPNDKPVTDVKMTKVTLSSK